MIKVFFGKHRNHWLRLEHETAYAVIPDLHADPDLIDMAIVSLRTAKHRLFAISTNSPTVLDLCEPGELFACDDDGEPRKMSANSDFMSSMDAQIQHVSEILKTQGLL